MLSEFSGDTLSTTELPARRAGMIFAVAEGNGEFQGITAATTPTASRRTTLRTGDAGSEGARVSSQPNSPPPSDKPRPAGSDPTDRPG